MRYISPQKIWTRPMLTRLGTERKHALQGEEPADDLQERVEGAFIEGAKPTYEPNEFAGEVIRFELRGGDVLKLEAIPPTPKKGRPVVRADMNVELIPKARTVYTGLVNPSGGPIGA